MNNLGNANTLNGLVVAVNGKQAEEPYGYYLEPEQPWKVNLRKMVKELALRTNLAFRLIRPSLSALSADPKQKFFHDKK